MSSVQFEARGSSFRFSESSIDACEPLLFDRAWLHASVSLLAANHRGRGQVDIFSHLERTLVLRHYHRGGLMRRLSKDRYLWQGLHRSRPWQEFEVLSKLADIGLPAPIPYACCVSRRGLTYSGSLITHYIPDSVTLAEKLCVEEVPDAQWYSLGACIRRFHDAGLSHSDLNANNILLTADGRIHLIDFDKACFKSGQGKAWKAASLRRLQRSIMKSWTSADIFFFSPASWAQLESGYCA